LGRCDCDFESGVFPISESKISASDQSSTNITFAAVADTPAGYGFYIENLTADIDAAHEWACTTDGGAEVVTLQEDTGINPSTHTILGTIRDDGIVCATKSYIAINGLRFNTPGRMG